MDDGKYAVLVLITGIFIALEIVSYFDYEDEELNKLGAIFFFIIVPLFYGMFVITIWRM